MQTQRAMSRKTESYEPAAEARRVVEAAMDDYRNRLA